MKCRNCGKEYIWKKPGDASCCLNPRKDRKRQARAHYSVLTVSEDDITIEDDHGPVSVTNDAEAVVEQLVEEFGPNFRIFYFDSNGDRDQLLHDNGKFTGFSPARDKA